MATRQTANHMVRRLLLPLVISITLAGCATTEAELPYATGDFASVTDIAPSVVELVSLDDQYLQSGGCTGTIIDPRGIILTNFHCVADTQTKEFSNPDKMLEVHMTSSYGSPPEFKYYAQVVATKADADLAVLQIVRDQLGKFLFPVHRLDRATSGILVYAFSRDLAADLQKSLMAETAQKEYQALVRWPGSFPDLGDRWVCDRPLLDDKDIAREAHSEFWLVEPFRRCALVGCRIATGRYHQIRRHSNHCGRHILGDTTHGKGRLNDLYRTRYGLDRLFLHAARLSLRHPVSGEPLVFEDPLPPELVAVMERLRADPALAANA